MTAVEKILKVLNQNAYKYTFGIRTDARELQVGDSLGVSHEWDWENGCEFEDRYLDGICATGFGELWFDGEEEDVEAVETALKINNGYRDAASYGAKGHQYLIGGHDNGYGNDEAEVILGDAIVLAII